MDIDEMKKIKDDAELVNAVYNYFDEKSRLNCSNAARVEFLTTVKYIEKYLKQGNALDLSDFEDEAFDVVLLFGPLYHLHGEEDRNTAIREAKRVLKKEGILFVAFINNDMLHYTEWGYDPDYLMTGEYDKETFKTYDFPFVFFNLDQCREMLIYNDLDIIHEIASDGMSELLEDKSFFICSKEKRAEIIATMYYLPKSIRIGLYLVTFSVS